jgi:hypothetical protein
VFFFFFFGLRCGLCGARWWWPSLGTPIRRPLGAGEGTIARQAAERINATTRAGESGPRPISVVFSYFCGSSQVWSIFCGFSMVFFFLLFHFLFWTYFSNSIKYQIPEW